MISFIKNSKKNISRTHFLFRYPALSAGISALLGIMNPWLGGFWLLIQAFVSIPRMLLHAILLCSFFFYSTALEQALPESMQGRFLFRIHSVQRTTSPFQKGWLYKGTLNGSIPCSFSYYKKGERPRANCAYFLTGKLVRRDLHHYTFKASNWEPIPNTWSLAELRLSTRESLRSLLFKHLSPRTTSLLMALFTGEKENRTLTYEFSRLGIQHILAISGFHFTLLVAFATLVAKQLFSSKKRIWPLFLIGTLYFLFIGDSPSVFRSFCTLLLFLFGKVTNRISYGLNLLGATLLIELILDPLVCYSIGFQLSFLSCFSILRFHKPIQQILDPLIPSHSFNELIGLSFPSQCGAVVVALLKKSLVLTLAVNLGLLPLLLFHFHYFPLLGLIYNLFIPELAAALLFLFLATLCIYSLAPVLSLPLFMMTEGLSSFLLTLVTNPPFLLDYHLSLSVPHWVVVLYLGILFLIPLRELTFSREPRENGGLYGDRSSVG